MVLLEARSFLAISPSSQLSAEDAIQNAFDTLQINTVTLISGRKLQITASPELLHIDDPECPDFYLWANIMDSVVYFNLRTRAESHPMIVLEDGHYSGCMQVILFAMFSLNLYLGTILKLMFVVENGH